MGNWKVEIEGLGAHGNGNPGDAESILRRAVETARCHQHSITKATFSVVDTSGDVLETEDLTAERLDAELQVENAMPEHAAQFFVTAHLPPHLKVVVAPFADLAKQIALLPRNPERTKAFDKLIEAKDAACRAVVAK